MHSYLHIIIIAFLCYIGIVMTIAAIALQCYGHTWLFCVNALRYVCAYGGILCFVVLCADRVCFLPCKALCKMLLVYCRWVALSVWCAESLVDMLFAACRGFSISAISNKCQMWACSRWHCKISV